MTEIRPFRRTDADAVIALWTECGLVRPWNDPRRDIERKLTVQPELFLVATTGSDLVGSVMAGYDGHRGWVNYLAVATGHRRRGLGRRLMREAEAGLRALGCPKLNLQIRTGNSAVVAFYEALGYGVDDVVSLGRRLIRDDEPTSTDASGTE
jgi:ribosomal protein S18 acetylase RimI-like enzyme